MREFNTIAEFILSKSSNPTASTLVALGGALSKGDVPTFNLVFAQSGQTPSQTPSQLGSALYNDASGNQWALVLGNNNLAELGYDPVTFSIPGTFADLPTAMDFFSHFKATDGRTATLNIETGYVIADGFRVQDIDLSFLTLTSTDAEVAISASMNLVSNTDLDAAVPRSSSIAFLAINAKMPNWGILVDLTGMTTMVTGYELDHGASGIILENKGVKNISNATPSVGSNCRVTTTSTFHSNLAVFSGASGVGIAGTVGSIVTCPLVDVSNCVETGLDISRGTTCYANGANADNCNEGVYVRRSTITVQGAALTNCTIGLRAGIGAKATATDATFDNSSSTIVIDNGAVVEAGGATDNAALLNNSNLPANVLFNSISTRGIVLSDDNEKWDVAYLNAESVISTTDVGSIVNVAASTYETAIDLAGKYRIHSGSIYSADVGMRITIDGAVIINDQNRAIGRDNSGDGFSVISLPPMQCETSIKIEVYNRSGVATDFGWKFYRENL